MNKAQLLKYAEHGVRERLQEIQLEINALARDFPQIVCHADGSVPAVAPIVAKVVKAKNVKLSNHQKEYWKRMSPAEKKKKIDAMIAARKRNAKARASQ